MSDEVSDEAFERWIANSDYSEMTYDAWQECRRRHEALIEEKEKEYNRQAVILMGTIQHMDQKLETERRRAFEAGWSMRGSGVHSICPAAYRAYTGAAKEEK